MEVLIVIPTRNRSDKVIKTLNFLGQNKFFYTQIVVVDSSEEYHKKKIKQFIDKENINAHLVNSEPSTCLQRNRGFSYIKNEKYIMFIDDDNQFYKNALTEMKIFLDNKKDFVGVAFNQILETKKNIIEKLKVNFLLNKIGIYPEKNGNVAKSGWHSKFLNFKNDTTVEWLPTRAVIYKSEYVKNLRFDTTLGTYGYLEDLDFSLSIKKYGKLMVCENAKYTHDQEIERSDFNFGEKEVKNRFYIVKKHKFNKSLFVFTILMKVFLNLILAFKQRPYGFQRVKGNIISLLSLKKI